MVMRDVACAGYVAGGNCRFFAEGEDGDFTVDSCNQNLMSRLSFDDDVTDKYASMLAFPAHEGQFRGGQLDTCMSVTTRVLPWEVQNTVTHDSFPGGNAMYIAYQNKLNLGQVHYGEDMKAAENQDFISQVYFAKDGRSDRRASDVATHPFPNLQPDAQTDAPCSHCA